MLAEATQLWESRASGKCCPRNSHLPWFSQAMGLDGRLGTTAHTSSPTLPPLAMEPPNLRQVTQAPVFMSLATQAASNTAYAQQLEVSP